MNPKTSSPLVEQPPAAEAAAEADGDADASTAASNGTGGSTVHQRRGPIQVALYALPLLVLLPPAWVHRYMFDDGYIYLRVVQEIIAGNGPVFNPGERVEAYTSPVWVLLVSLEAALFGRWVELGWLAVMTGMVLTSIAIVVGVVASAKLLGFARRGETALAWPVGAVAIACLPPMWYYATSGLETSLSFAWLAICFYGLIPDPIEGTAPFRRSAPKAWVPVCIGLGVLVRPEFALYTIGFLVALWIVRLGTWRQRAVSLVWMFAIPSAYELFRMGYFASLLPNTAIAKGATDSDIDRGLTYFRSFNDTNQILIPVAAIVVLAVVLALRILRQSGLAVALVAAPWAAAVVNGLYVVKVGGDYLPARFWLPPLFTMLLPVMCWDFRLPSREGATTGESRPKATGLAASALPLAMAAVLLGWAVWIAAPAGPYVTDFDQDFKVYGLVGPSAPAAVTLDDYNLLSSVGRRLAANQAAGANALVDVTRPLDPQPFFDQPTTEGPISYPLKPGQGVVGYFAGVGVGSVAAGPDVWVVDRHGLADVLVARLAEKNGQRDVNGRLVPGHEKQVPFTYAQARFTHSAMGEPLDVALYRSAMSCGQLADLYRATNEPLTVGRFLENVVKAPSFTTMTVPPDPRKMYEKFCGAP